MLVLFGWTVILLRGLCSQMLVCSILFQHNKYWRCYVPRHFNIIGWSYISSGLITSRCARYLHSGVNGLVLFHISVWHIETVIFQLLNISGWNTSVIVSRIHLAGFICTSVIVSFGWVNINPYILCVLRINGRLNIGTFIGWLLLEI